MAALEIDRITIIVPPNTPGKTFSMGPGNAIRVRTLRARSRSGIIVSGKLPGGHSLRAHTRPMQEVITFQDIPGTGQWEIRFAYGHVAGIVMTAMNDTLSGVEWALKRLILPYVSQNFYVEER